MKRVASIGECMIEVATGTLEPDSRAVQFGFGGDTLNTAIYLARSLDAARARVDYVTALGDDPFSDDMVHAWRGECVGTNLVQRLARELPGLYLIRNDALGERTFFYWRNQAAVRKLFHHGRARALHQALCSYDLVYASAISVAILDPDSRAHLLALLRDVRSNGGMVAFDSNYRPQLWRDEDEARREVERFATATSIGLPSFEDESKLFGDPTPGSAARRWLDWGVDEVVVKNGAEACTVVRREGEETVSPTPVENPLDTTAAGDSFNAAYLAARLEGLSPTEAARRGHTLAGRVVQHHGAIIPR